MTSGPPDSPGLQIASSDMQVVSWRRGRALMRSHRRSFMEYHRDLLAQGVDPGTRLMDFTGDPWSRRRHDRQLRREAGKLGLAVSLVRKEGDSWTYRLSLAPPGDPS
jgi:hypothetical protein